VISNNKVKKILLVDDEPDITFTIKSMLNHNGFQIYTFNDPITPLKLYRSNFYDLVILDIRMPKMDGFELYIKIKEKDPKAKICFLTAIATFNEEFREARSEVGRIIAEECFIQKPVTTEDLVRKLTDIMNIDVITMPI
jgi:two-component system catabolic regulation response regulator CreB/two-component system response regulator ChvI